MVLLATIEALKIYNAAGKFVVHIPAFRGEELGVAGKHEPQE